MRRKYKNKNKMVDLRHLPTIKINLFSNIHTNILFFGAPIIIVTITMMTGAILMSSTVKADNDSAVDQVNITVPVSCTMSGTGMNTHNAEIQNGIYTPNIGTTTIHAFCNDSEGFAIYAAGYTGDEIGGTDSTKLVGNSNAIGNIVTGIATSGNISNWAMKIAITQDSGDTTGTNAFAIDSDTEGSFGSYHTVPNEYTKVAHKNTATDMDASTGGVKLTTTYAAYISKNQSAGTYSGQVKYTLVHPVTEIPAQPQATQSGKICYYANTTIAEGTMGCQDIMPSDTSITLLASNFSRAGYGFAGWSTTHDYSDPDGFLGPQEEITFTAGQYTDNNPGLSLYAHWIESAGNIQGWTGCPSLAFGAVTALKDQRDSEVYAVAKLADGNCWMIENMRLDNTAIGNSDGSLAQGYGGQFVGLAEPETPWANKITTANSLYYSGVQDGTASIDIGTNEAIYRFPRHNNQNSVSRGEAPTSGENTYSYGSYYTWHAAIADVTAFPEGDYNTTSICPTGWSIPRGGSKTQEATNDYWSFVITGINEGVSPENYDSETSPYYSGISEGKEVSNKLRSYPNNFVYSGYIGSSEVRNRGSAGLYWTSTAKNNGVAYHFALDGETVQPGNGGSNKYVGRVIRCIISGT